MTSGRAREWDTFIGFLAPASGDRILDIGAGTCKNAARVFEVSKGAEVCAIDPNEKKIASARRDRPSVRSSVGVAESLSFPDAHFDKVYSTLALHHFANLDKALDEIARVLKAGGSFVVLEIEPASFSGRLFRVLGKLMGEKLTFMDKEGLEARVESGGRFRAVRSAKFGGDYLVQFSRS